MVVLHQDPSQPDNVLSYQVKDAGASFSDEEVFRFLLFQHEDIPSQKSVTYSALYWDSRRLMQPASPLHVLMSISRSLSTVNAHRQLIRRLKSKFGYLQDPCTRIQPQPVISYDRFRGSFSDHRRWAATWYSFSWISVDSKAPKTATPFRPLHVKWLMHKFSSGNGR